MALFFVRHGRPVIDRERPAATWTLDPAALGDIEALRPRLPRSARWVTSPEPKAVDTARVLLRGDAEVVEDLREIARPTAVWSDDFEAVVARTFAHPDEPAHEGWETAAACQRRIVAAVRPLVPRGRGEHLVLVGHGTAFTLLIAGLTGTAPDLRRWRSLAMPDLLRLDQRAVTAEG